MPVKNHTSDLEVNVYGERFVLNASGAMLWRRKRWLIISDLHLGKSMHFRKKGIAVPGQLDEYDIKRLTELIDQYRPIKVLFLGDLFHSEYNVDWERFAQFTHHYRKGFFVLVRGNHDILPDWHFGRAQMQIIDEIKVNQFHFTHHPQDEVISYINICGHLHPGIRLSGKARQRLRLPAFFFRENRIILPAYGRFTGIVCIKPLKTDQIYAIAEGEVVAMT